MRSWSSSLPNHSPPNRPPSNASNRFSRRLKHRSHSANCATPPACAAATSPKSWHNLSMPVASLDPATVIASTAESGRNHSPPPYISLPSPPPTPHGSADPPSDRLRGRRPGRGDVSRPGWPKRLQPTNPTGPLLPFPASRLLYSRWEAETGDDVSFLPDPPLHQSSLKQVHQLSWPLSTPTTDSITLGIDVGAAASSSSLASPIRSHTRSLPPIKVPLGGATTTFTVAVTI